MTYHSKIVFSINQFLVKKNKSNWENIILYYKLFKYSVLYTIVNVFINCVGKFIDIIISITVLILICSFSFYI